MTTPLRPQAVDALASSLPELDDAALDLACVASPSDVPARRLIRAARAASLAASLAARAVVAQARGEEEPA